MKITIDLKQYNGIIVRATTDEKLYEIEKAIVYNDHGDEFLVVKTKDGHVYRYGFFCGRPGYPQYHELANNPCKFITVPKLYKFFDHHYQKSNEFSFWWGDNIEITAFKPHNYSPESANRVFNAALDHLEELYKSGIYYDKNLYKSDLYRFLTKYNIETEENRKRIDAAHWDSRINGVDGEAGKEEFTGRAIYFDEIAQRYNVSAKNVRGKKDHRDEFGFETRVLYNF